MSTRLYFSTPNDYTPLVTPSIVPVTPVWTSVTSTVMNLVTSPSEIEQPETSITHTISNPRGQVRNFLLARYITPPLAAGPLNTQIKAMLKAGSTTNPKIVAMSQMTVRVVGTDGRIKPGGTDAGLILGAHTGTPAAYGSQLNWTIGDSASQPGSGLPNLAYFPSGTPSGAGPALLPYILESGDRLLIEIGARARNEDNPPYLTGALTMRYGTRAAATDYPETPGYATFNSAETNGWIEFSQSLTFLPEPRDVELDLDSLTNNPTTLTDVAPGGTPWTVSGSWTTVAPGLTSKYTNYYSPVADAVAYTSTFPAGLRTMEFMFSYDTADLPRLLDFNSAGTDGIFFTSTTQISVLGQTIDCDFGSARQHHVLISLSGDGFLDLYVNGVFMERRPTTYKAFPGGTVWLNGSPFVAGNAAIKWQAFKATKFSINGNEALDRYRSMMTVARTAIFKFDEGEGNFLNTGTSAMTMIPIGSWHRANASIAGGYAKSSKTILAAAYGLASNTPTSQKSFDILFQTSPTDGAAEPIALGDTGNFWLQTTIDGRVKVMYNGTMLAQSAAGSFVPGATVYVAVNIVGTSGGELIVGSGGVTTPVTWASGGPANLVSSAQATYVNGRYNTPAAGTPRYQAENTVLQALNIYPLRSTTALERSVRYVTTAGQLAQSSVALSALLNGTGGVNVTVNVGSLATVTLYRVVGNVAENVVEVIYKNRKFNGDFVYVDSTVPFNQDITYRVIANFDSGGASGFEVTVVGGVPEPDPDLGSCYPAFFNDPQDPNSTPLGATLQTILPMSYDARTGLFDIVGESMPVAVNSVRGAAKYTLTVMTHTDEGAQRMRSMLSRGRPLFIRVPVDARPEKAYWYATVQGLTENQVMPSDLTVPLRKWNLEVVEIQRPDTASGLSSPNTWAGVRANNTTWTTLAARAGTWYNVVNDTNIGSIPG